MLFDKDIPYIYISFYNCKNKMSKYYTDLDGEHYCCTNSTDNMLQASVYFCWVFFSSNTLTCIW